MLTSFNASALRRAPRTALPFLAAFTLVVGTLFTAGCGGKGADSSGDGKNQGLSGNWTVTLNEGAENQTTLPLRLRTQGGEVSGTVAGMAITDASYRNGELSFTADSFPIEGLAGTVEVPGPTMWTATRNGNRLQGTVQSELGRTEPWSATRSGR